MGLALLRGRPSTEGPLEEGCTQGVPGGWEGATPAKVWDVPSGSRAEGSAGAKALSGEKGLRGNPGGQE